jgi:hypothetical protein
MPNLTLLQGFSAALISNTSGLLPKRALRVYTQISDRRKRAVYASGGVVARALHDLTANPR